MRPFFAPSVDPAPLASQSQEFRSRRRQWGQLAAPLPAALRQRPKPVVPQAQEPESSPTRSQPEPAPEISPNSTLNAAPKAPNPRPGTLVVKPVQKPWDHLCQCAVADRALSHVTCCDKA